MLWTHAWATVFALHCVAPPKRLHGAFVRVLAVPKASHAPIVHPATEDDDSRTETPDFAECLWAASYTCLQRKTAVYLDALNRRDRIRLLGDFVTAVRTRPVDARRPTISDSLLEARGLNNVLSLSAVVDSVVRSMVQDHAIRISFPRIADLGDPGVPAAAALAHDDPARNKVTRKTITVWR